MRIAHNPEIVIISALAENRAIGKDGHLPWHLPEDLQRFRLLTLNQTVIMGRKTWELDLGKCPLSDRTNLVVSKSYFQNPLPPPETSHDKNLYILPSIDAALHQARTKPVVFIIGGASIYTQTLHLVDRLELTLVEGSVEGDTFFPDYAAFLQDQFVLTHETPHAGYRFVTYCRRG